MNTPAGSSSVGSPNTIRFQHGTHHDMLRRRVTDSDRGRSTSVEICAFFNERQQYYTGQRVFGADTWQVVRFVPAWFCGFFIAGTLVGRTHRVHTAAMLSAFALSVLIVMSGAAIMVWVYPYPTRVPHALFYVIFTALPYVWWVGFVLVPVLILAAGFLGTAGGREGPRGWVLAASPLPLAAPGFAGPHAVP